VAFLELRIVLDISRRFEGTCCPSFKWVNYFLIVEAVFVSKHPYLQDYTVSRHVRESSSPPNARVFPLRMKEYFAHNTTEQFNFDVLDGGWGFK
jgi:hypothetical protein